MEEAYSYYTAPLRLPDPPRKGVPWLTVNTSPTTLYGNKPPEAVKRKYFGNTSPPPSLCSCGNCADYPDAVDNNAEILDDKTPDVETLNDYHQAKRDAVPRGKRPRAKLGCLFADPRYMSDPEPETEVPASAADDDAAGQGNVGPNEAFPVFIDDNLNVHEYFSCHFAVPNPQKSDKDDQSDEKASGVTRRRPTYPKTPAPVSSCKLKDSCGESELDANLADALKTISRLQRDTRYVNINAGKLQSQLDAIKRDVDDNNEAWREPPRRPLGPGISILMELSWAFIVAWCTFLYMTGMVPRIAGESAKLLFSVNIGITVAMVSSIVASMVNPRGIAVADGESDHFAIVPKAAEKQADSNTIIDEDGF